MAEQARGKPNIPSNYLTLKQLQELRLQEKQREEYARLQKVNQQQQEEAAQRLRKLKKEQDRRQDKLPREREVLKSKEPLLRRSNPPAIELPDRDGKDESDPNVDAKPKHKWERKKKTKKPSKVIVEGAAADPSWENGSDGIRSENGRLRWDGPGPVVRRVKSAWRGEISPRVGRDGGKAEMKPRSTAGMRTRGGGRLVRFEDLSGKGLVWVQKSPGS